MSAGTPLVDRIREDLLSAPGAVDIPRVARLLREEGRVVGAAQLLRITASLRDHVTGLGPLEHLAAPGVTDILVNADGTVWVDDAAGLHAVGERIPVEDARALAVRLATAGGRRLDDAAPCVDARLPDGTRLHAVLPPLSTGGALISLRRPARVRMSLADLTSTGALSPVTREVLEAVIASRVAFLISGGTGSGKTTLLAAMLAGVPAVERMILVEDARELDPDHPHVVHLQSRHPNAEGAGGVDLSTLVRQCLRMRPDRIVVGECRGAEVRELLQALNTGHEGGCGTLHANAAADVPARLEALGALGGLGTRALASQAASALDVVIHLARRDGVRTVDHIARLVRSAEGTLASEAVLDVSGPQPVPGPGWPAFSRRIGLAPDVLSSAAGAGR